MVSTSKILTVSYGTFSCTLEGFDDSFDTMKAIAEYFRDLAADDRYFGAEPPTPDAEMLARIAQNEIARRVEAHEDAGNIHLRAAAAPSLPAAAPVEEARAPETEPDATLPAETDTATDEEIPTLEDDITLSEEPSADATSDTTSERDDALASETMQDEDDGTQDADMSVAASIESAMAAAEDDVSEEVAIATEEDADPEDVLSASIETAVSAAHDAPETDMPPMDEDFAETGPDIAEDTPDAEEPIEAMVDEAVSDEPAAPEDEDDSVAARLRRIRSVVSGGAPDFDIDAFSEDEHAQDFLNDTVSDLDAALMADAPGAADLLEDPTQAENVAARDHGEEVDTLDADDNTLAEDGTDNLLEGEEDTFEDDAADIENLAEDTLAQLLADAIPEDAPAMDGEIEDEETFETPLRARVIKMKRSDFEAAVSDGAIEETFDVLAEDDHDDEPADAILSPEDEADLQSELDAVTAELEADAGGPVDAVEPDYDTLEDEIVAEEDDHETTLSSDDYEEVKVELDKSQRLGKSDQPVSRLFDEAQSQLSTPEAMRRRNAIQHLRAAVEANEAEADVGSDLRRTTDEGAYRSDLEDVMRTNDEDQPVETEGTEDTASPRPRTRRPVESRPAPLKLVAEQRVDMPRDPVRPRRVSTVHLSEPVDLPSTAGSFTEFAEEIGAKNLSDLIEAAAAYMADIEGRVQFSRPMLMNKLKEATAEDFSREDSLKSFGQLLRSGKLQKLKGGRFTVTDDTEFRAKERDAG